jgi:S-DNA-T family DNA segregation ATPase FtsK/SpoIIIE
VPRAAAEGERLKREIAAVSLLTAAALVLASLFYGSHGGQTEGAGYLPALIATVLRLSFGVGAYAVPLVLFVVGLCYAMEKPSAAAPRALAGAGVLFTVILTATALQVPTQGRFEPEWVQLNGGYLGAGVAYAFSEVLGATGAYIVLGGMALLALILLTDTSTKQMLGVVARAIGAAIVRLYELVVAAFGLLGELISGVERAPRRDRRQGGRGASQAKQQRRPDRGPVVELGVGDDEEKALRPPKRKNRSKGNPTATEEEQPPLLGGNDLYSPPPLSILSEIRDEGETRAAQEEATENIIKLEDSLQSFGIDAKVTRYEQGPVITRYEVEPERGIRVGRIANLADDLAMALAAVDVRVEAPIPGKSAIGIEVPNQHRALVSLRGILEAPEMRDDPSTVAVALGRDIAGHPVVGDLSRMPHLLVAGATNAGKSVCLHALITSLLMRARPDEVRFILIDPKRVELRLYDGIPHLYSPVVYSPREAADVLRKAIREMEKRYDLFALKGCVNIAEYNELAAMPKEDEEDEFEPLPRVVIVIDELADLMMQSKAEFEFSVCRIAQLARATGIHLVVSTQRPSVNVITGTIKANIPSRIALSVTSQHDSRTILDGQGAERLIGRGDMLYSPLDANRPRRLQGAFVPREDLHRLVEYLCSQGEPEFQIIPQVPDDDQEDFASDLEVSDKLYTAAVQYVVAEGEASVSMLQRRFKIGYARAGRLIDAMEQRGVVGPHEGPKPREVMIGAAMVDDYLTGRMQPVPPGAEDSALADQEEPERQPTSDLGPASELPGA